MSRLPKGWAEVPLKEVAKKITDGSHNPPRDQPNGIPMLSARNIRSGLVHFDEFRRISPDEFEVEHRRSRITRGDVLLTIVGAIGRSAVVQTDERFAVQRSVAVIGELSGVLPAYLAKCTSGPAYQAWLLENSRGTAQKGVYLKKLATSVIPLPPLPEQKRIVAKLDELNAKSARASTELARVEPLVHRYKQAMLRKAFSGELTREWRTQRANLASWQYLPLSKLIVDGPTNGWSPKADGKVGGLKSLKLSATSSGTLRLNENTIKYLDQTLPEDSRFWLLANDILIQRANSLELLGTTVLFEGPPSEFIFPDLMMRVRADERKALPKYLATFLNSDGARTYFRANATGTAGNMPKINGTTVRETRVPAPLLEEQREIVRRIESAFAKIDRLANEARRALELVGRLDEAILAKAFRGELAPQDDSDEPAEHLLARIRAERQTTPQREQVHRKSNLTTHGTTGSRKMGSARDTISEHPLVSVLSTLGGSSSSEELWKRSEMTIDDFYKQLRDEMAAGTILEGSEKTILVLPDEN